MNKLIVETKDAPMRKVNAILNTWARLAELVDDKVILTRGCELEWELEIQHLRCTNVFSTPKGTDSWQAYSAVRMVFPARVEGIAVVDKHSMNIALTEVQEVMIYDDGTFYWHSSERTKPEDDPETISHLAEAVSRGKLLRANSWYHYRKNWIPTIIGE